MQFGDGENLEMRNVVWEFRNRIGKVQGVPRKLPPAINRSHSGNGKLPRAMNPLAIGKERNLLRAMNPTHRQ